MTPGNSCNLTARIANTKGKTDPDLGERKVQAVRKQFEPSLLEFTLPAFVVKDSYSKDGTRIVDPTIDITPHIPFHEIDLSSLSKLHIDKEGRNVETTVAIGFSRDIVEDSEEFLDLKTIRSKTNFRSTLRKSFWVQNILEFIPNPWIANELVERSLGLLKKIFSMEEIESNQ